MRASLLRACAGCSILAIVVLSWLPSHAMTRTGVLLPSEEHFLAYMLSGVLVAAAMPRYRFVHVACFYILLATLLELGQNWAQSGRLRRLSERMWSDCGRGRGAPHQRLWPKRHGPLFSARLRPLSTWFQ